MKTRISTGCCLNITSLFSLMGGSPAGKHAADVTVAKFAEFVELGIKSKQDKLELMLRQAAVETSRFLFDESLKHGLIRRTDLLCEGYSGKPMGSTLVALLIGETTDYWTSVGGSRIYRLW